MVPLECAFRLLILVCEVHGPTGFHAGPISLMCNHEIKITRGVQ